jgi:hypothetical protein
VIRAEHQKGLPDVGRNQTRLGRRRSDGGIERERLPGCELSQEMRKRLRGLADHTGADTVQIGFNRGAMPQEMFLEQIRRFGKDVLPRLQAHQVKRVPAAETVAA